MNKEVCICSALLLPNGMIIRGHRHHDCIRTAVELINHRHSIGLEPEPWLPGMASPYRQGFVTSSNRYVDRKEGMKLQLAAGIPSVSKGGYHLEDLYSEDLY